MRRRRARELRQARLYPNPIFEVSRVGNRLQQETEATFGFTPPLLGRHRAAIAIAEADLRRAEAEVRETERQIAGTILSAHAESLRASRALEMLQQLADVDREIASLLDARVRVQDAAPLDLKILGVEIRRLEARQLLLRAEAQRHVLELRTLVGVPDREDLTLQSDFLIPGVPSDDLDTLTTRALAQRSDVRAARAEEAVAAATLARARIEARPELGFFARYTSQSGADTGPAGSQRLFGGGISIMLPFMNRNQGAVAEASAAVEQARLRRVAVEARVGADIRSAVLSYQAARKAISIYQSDVSAKARENLATLREAFRLGAVSLSDVLNEQRRMFEAESELTEALNEAYRAGAELQLALGTELPEEAATP